MSRDFRPETAFADTERLPRLEEGAPWPAAGSGPLRLWACGCGKDSLARVARLRWMRLVPFWALYECGRCRARVFRTRLPYRPMRAVYLQARPGVGHVPRLFAKMLEKFSRANLHG